MYITLIKDGGEKMVKNIKKTLQIIAICVCTLTFSMQSITIADEQDEWLLMEETHMLFKMKVIVYG